MRGHAGYVTPRREPGPTVTIEAAVGIQYSGSQSNQGVGPTLCYIDASTVMEHMKYDPHLQYTYHNTKSAVQQGQNKKYSWNYTETQ